MRLHFQLPEYDAQLLRTCGYIYSEGADLGECLVTAHRIKEGDRESWMREWCRTADRIYDQAKESLRSGHIISARQGLLRASNYFRTATFFYYDSLNDPKFIETYERHVSTFNEALHLLNPIVETVEIPFEGTTLPAYFYSPDGMQVARPVVIVNQGYDATQQESYFFIVTGALARGYNVLTFDGPGQGAMLILKHLYMRYNWETVVTPIVDYLYSRVDVDKEAIALIGLSWGGYLAPRAAAFEPRINALIALPGIYSPVDIIIEKMPGVKEYYETGNSSIVESSLEQVMQMPTMAFRFRSRMAIHGKETFVSLLDDWRRYTLEGVTENIKCPTLIFDTENEVLSSGQAKPLYDKLRCPKEYQFLSNAEGAGEHCAAGALALVQQKMFDWLGNSVFNRISYIN